MINVWILTMIISNSYKDITSFQLKFDSVGKCEYYRKYLDDKLQYQNSDRPVQKGICVQTQEQKN